MLKGSSPISRSFIARMAYLVAKPEKPGPPELHSPVPTMPFVGVDAYKRPDAAAAVHFLASDHAGLYIGDFHRLPFS